MKKLISIVILSLFFAESVSALDMLRPPSLLVQMKRQEKVDIAARVLEKKIKNQMRLAEIRARKKGEEQSQDITSTPTTSIIPKSTGNYSASNPNNISNVDMSKVRNAWFTWYNDYRSSLGLRRYNYDMRLDSTSHDWNITFVNGKGENHHRRNTRDSYYDFPVIDAWFKSRGIDPKVINRSKHTENVGYGYYSCTSSDCTDALIRSIRSTYDFFMSEKGKSYDAHYRSIINPYFTKMGFDIIVVPTEKRYYITVHYITE